MIRRNGLALCAALGVFAIIAAILIDNRPSQPATPVRLTTTPFPSYVAGAGIVEPYNGNIAVGTPVAGIVTSIEVRPGDEVKAHAALFRIDDADLQAQRPVALAAVQEARVRLEQANEQYRLALNVPDMRAVSKDELISRHSAVKVTQAALASAQARVNQLRIEVERRTVRALVPGKILQVNIRPGEFAQGSATGKPLLVMGSADRLALRVDVDEFEAMRVKPGARAVAFMRARPDVQVPLTFERIEPSIGAKTSLTGNSTERVDTRVLQIIYSFAPSDYPAYVGQQLDVYIEASGGERAR
jgi:HlyD family secretion protein